MTTMDFLIIFIALIVPNLTGWSSQNYNLGMLAAEIIIFFFSYEVLIKELREKFDAIAITTLTATLLLTARGFAGL